MHRNRTWSFISPFWRSTHNRIVDINGYIPALQYIIWQPSDLVFLSTGTTLSPIRDAITITNTYQPVRLGWEVISGIVPRNVVLYYRKNGGSWVSFAEKTNTAVTFTDGDTFQLGAQTGNITGLFSLVLSNSVDGLQCSQLLTISVS
jgi:hypothetical protein